MILLLANSPCKVTAVSKSHICEDENIILMGCNVNLLNLFKRLDLLGCKKTQNNTHLFEQPQNARHTPAVGKPD